MLIEDLDHLLIRLFALGSSDGHAYQTAKLTYTMIDMHNEVAHLELLDLLQRKSHLTTTGLVALQVVLMETVKDLVVGKETNAQVVIHKTFMKGSVNAHKRALRGERCVLTIVNVFQTLDLFLTVGKDINLVALKEVILERLRQQVEILMEERLNSDIEM